MKDRWRERWLDKDRKEIKVDRKEEKVKER